MPKGVESFRVSSKQLAAALGRMKGAYGGKARSYGMVWDCVKIEAGGEGLRLHGTNLAISISLSCPAEVTAPATLCLPFQQLSQFLAAIGEDAPASFAVDNWSAIVTAGRAKVRLDGCDPEEYPTLPQPGETILQIEAAALLPAIARVLPAIAEDDSRPVLNCLSVVLTSEGVVLAGADGFNLAFERLDATAALAGEPGAPLLIQRDALPNIERLFDKTGPLTIARTTNDTHCALQQNDRTLICTAVEGTFPNYRPIVPTRVARTITAPAGRWLAALHIASLYPDQNSISCCAHFERSDGGEINVTFSRQAEASMAASSTAGDELKILLDPERFGKLFAGVPADMPVDLALNGPSSPVVARPAELECTSVVMPMGKGT